MAAPRASEGLGSALEGFLISDMGQFSCGSMHIPQDWTSLRRIDLAIAYLNLGAKKFDRPRSKNTDPGWNEPRAAHLKMLCRNHL